MREKYPFKNRISTQLARASIHAPCGLSGLWMLLHYVGLGTYPPTTLELQSPASSSVPRVPRLRPRRAQRVRRTDDSRGEAPPGASIEERGSGAPCPARSQVGQSRSTGFSRIHTEVAPTSTWVAQSFHPMQAAKISTETKFTEVHAAIVKMVTQGRLPARAH